MRNNVVTIATTATLIASQLAVPAMPQATTLPYPNPGGPQIQPPRPGGPQIQPPRPGGPQIVLPVRPGDGYAGTIRCESRNTKQKRCNFRTVNSVEFKRSLVGFSFRRAPLGFTPPPTYPPTG